MAQHRALQEMRPIWLVYLERKNESRQVDGTEAPCLPRSLPAAKTEDGQTYFQSINDREYSLDL